MTPIFSSITDTLSYFDQFSYPLTAGELHYYLWQPPASLSYADFLTELSHAVTNQVCGKTGGYYHLPGRQSIIEERCRRLLFVEEKMNIARRAARLMSLVPFVQTICVCNTVAAGWPTEQSDIDVFIIVREGRLWLTRILITGLTALTRLRRSHHRVTDLVCLSFYVTDEHLDISAVRINEPDIYLTYWIKQLIPLYDPKKFLPQFLKKNCWVNGYIPFSCLDKEMLSSSLVKNGFFGNTLKKMLTRLLRGSLGDWLERRARSWQRRRIDARPHAPEPSVVISDSMLKFHEEDRREEYQKEWLRRRSSYRIERWHDLHTG